MVTIRLLKQNDVHNSGPWWVVDRSSIFVTDNSLKDLIDSCIAELRHDFEQFRLPRVQRHATYFAHVHSKASVAIIQYITWMTKTTNSFYGTYL